MDTREPDADPQVAPPRRPPRPPAPPGAGDPGRPEPDPSDPGPPIGVRLNDCVLGDLGHARVDARLLQAILLREGRVSAWLRERGVDLDAVEATFPGSGWPLRRP